MLYIRSAIYTLGLVAFSANAFEGEGFQHKDWYLACDNTGTCRAAGYSDTDSLNPVAVMFTREAGPEPKCIWGTNLISILGLSK
ncbi:DUF1176 domain-containing protein [Vibrio vulnificus]